MKGILAYNWPFYARTSAGVVAALLVALNVPPLWRDLLLLSASPALWWTCSSLAVSYYVYDRSSLYGLNWLNSCLSRPPRRWVNIHAGLDETSHRLAVLFPAAEGRVLDIYDPTEMTEPSIAEARRLAHAQLPSTSANWRALPLPDHTFDAVFLIFAAHELRRADARAQLFSEAARVLSTGGELILVEHLRDWANFVAFGPGFFHFLTECAWQRAVATAGLRVHARLSLTPFVTAFVLRGPE